MAFILGNLKKLSDEQRELTQTSWLGHALVLSPFETETAINLTAGPGSTIGVFNSLIFMLGKAEYQGVVKFDESIDVSPVHQQYYQLTHKQKEELESRIKSGLGSTSQAIADLELLLHDQRKYREFLDYLGYRTYRQLDELAKKKPPEDIPKNYDELDLSDDEKTRKARDKRIDNHSLKAVFIDQVDAHTGEVSIRSIISRWPTLISDFMRMDETDTDPDKVKAKLDVSRAEAVVLVTKNKLYIEWRSLFLTQVRSRFERIATQTRSREKSVEKYREWLTPIVARHEMINDSLGTEKGRADALASPLRSGGHAMSSQTIELWAWKDFMSGEFYKGGSELSAQMGSGSKLGDQGGELDPYDQWTKDNFIWHKKDGLVTDFPWLTEEWIQDQKKDMFSMGWMTRKVYYSFFTIKYIKTLIRMPTGEELEDGVYNVKMTCMSRNALFAKLLQLKAKQEDLNRYVSDLIGIPRREKPDSGKMYKPPAERGGIPGAFAQAMATFSIIFSFARNPGPYERHFDERITKYYLQGMANERYEPIVSFLKKKMSFGMVG